MKIRNADLGQSPLFQYVVGFPQGEEIETFILGVHTGRGSSRIYRRVSHP